MKWEKILFYEKEDRVSKTIDYMELNQDRSVKRRRETRRSKSRYVVYLLLNDLIMKIFQIILKQNKINQSDFVRGEVIYRVKNRMNITVLS